MQTEPGENDPQWKVLYRLVNLPKLAKVEPLDLDWFSKPYDMIVDFVIKHSGLRNYIEFRSAFEESHPKALTRTQWEPVLTGDIITTSYQSWVKILRTTRIRQKAALAMKTALSEPTDDNMQAAADALQVVISHPEEKAVAGMPELADEVLERIAHPQNVESGIKTMSQIDTILGDGLLGGRLLTIGARPAVGKSAFAINMIMQALAKQAVTIDLFTLEMSAKEVYLRMLSYMTGIEGRRLIRMPFRMSDRELTAIKSATQTMRGYDFKPWDNLSTLDQITSTIRDRQAHAKGKYLAVIDYLGLISVPGKQDRRLQIEQITRQFKVLTQELNVPIIMLSQLSRNIESRSGAAKQPKLSDLRESGSIEQDSNEVAFLFNTDDTPNNSTRNVTLAFAKNREGELGEIPFWFHADRMKFEVAL